MSNLCKDVLYLIFEELQGDSKSLFSCLLVNKLWCEVVVPILWKDPWCSTNGDGEISQNIMSLFYIFILLLSESNKKFTNIKFQLPQLLQRPPLFNYLSFCRSINASVINKLVSIYSSSDIDQYYFQREIYGLLMSQCPTLKYLDLRSLKLQIFLLPEATNRFEYLCELTCDTSMESTYFSGIASICQNIQRLIIINSSPEDNEGLASLIEVQNNLRYLEWEDNLDVDYMREFFLEDCYKKIILALKKKADTLIYFINNFNNIEYFADKFSKFLSELHNLKVLKLNNISDDEFKSSKFQHLEVLHLDNATLKAANCLIKNSGGLIKKIFIGDFEIFADELYQDSLKLIRTVREKCPLVEFLSLMFLTSDEHFIELEHLLRTCQNLKVLLLVTFGDKTFEERLGEKILNLLVRSASINLSVIGIFFDFNIPINIFGEFLENWKGRPALSIITSNDEYNNEEYTKVIDKYKEIGVIKEFGCNFIDNLEY